MHLYDKISTHFVNKGSGYIDLIFYAYVSAMCQPNLAWIQGFCLSSWPLLHWGLVTPFGDIDVGQHWLR